MDYACILPYFRRESGLVVVLHLGTFAALHFAILKGDGFTSPVRTSNPRPNSMPGNQCTSGKVSGISDVTSEAKKNSRGRDIETI